MKFSKMTRRKRPKQDPQTLLSFVDDWRSDDIKLPSTDELERIDAAELERLARGDLPAPKQRPLTTTERRAQEATRWLRYPTP